MFTRLLSASLIGIMSIMIVGGCSVSNNDSPQSMYYRLTASQTVGSKLSQYWVSDSVTITDAVVVYAENRVFLSVPYPVPQLTDSSIQDLIIVTVLGDTTIPVPAIGTVVAVSGRIACRQEFCYLVSHRVQLGKQYPVDSAQFAAVTGLLNQATDPRGTTNLRKVLNPLRELDPLFDLNPLNSLWEF